MVTSHKLIKNHMNVQYGYVIVRRQKESELKVVKVFTL